MDQRIVDKLSGTGLLTQESRDKLQQPRLFSIHWEVNTLLYLGVLLLSGGLGILVYKNIDTIGHQAILLLIGLTCGLCFMYAYKKKRPFSRHKVLAPNVGWDYVVLLGCLLFITFVTYLQAQYNVFGTRYGSATFIPMLVLLFSAYYFDHLGVLSLAITNFAAWMGIAITPYEILTSNHFNTDTRLIFTGILLGVILIAAGYLSEYFDFKKHFTFTYDNFGVHILFISLLAGMFVMPSYFFFFLGLLAFSAFCYWQSKKRRSFYFMMITTLYLYIALGYLVIRMLFFSGGSADPIGALYLALFYFIGSAVAMVLFLIRQNKKLKHDRI
ncbi:DUF2157 domain-containing protein [Chitinophaga sp. GCM10012297]|uniref:DUF2157 domain-containing protein n=1 Tax=Chitinophaga chungangae TaxID=2821488 RepID=A0ABS3YHK2_9BACT|nr:DUF2157 domain-containing protein [Chitinophaga chungangae]MBO9154169.1 DUF2157 domain-containing protein [Chitinophaga chungangae]